MAKAPQITEPVFGYNNEGKRHRASNDVLVWLDREITASEILKADFEQKAKEVSYREHEIEIARHTEDGYLSALQYVKLYLENRID